MAKWLNTVCNGSILPPLRVGNTLADAETALNNAAGARMQKGKWRRESVMNARESDEDGRLH